MLEKFRGAKQAEIAHLKALETAQQLPLPFSGQRPSFSDALLAHRPIAVIAEYKRASPSRGDINLDVPPADIAAMYAGAGAAAISVLTEETYFKGSIDYLEAISGAGLPMLRKDFLLHPLQVVETAATKASALLLIVRMLTDAELAEMLRLTYDAGLEAVVEGEGQGIEVVAPLHVVEAGRAVLASAAHDQAVVLVLAPVLSKQAGEVALQQLLLRLGLAGLCVRADAAQALRVQGDVRGTLGQHATPTRPPPLRNLAHVRPSRPDVTHRLLVSTPAGPVFRGS